MTLLPRVRLSFGRVASPVLALALLQALPVPVACGQTPTPALDEAFQQELARSKEDALKQYPDLADPQSALSKKCALIEQQMREDGNPVITRANHPLVIVRRAADELGIRPVGDPIFKDIIPAFTTASGTTYKEVRISKILKDSISILHESGVATIPYLELTDEQRERFRLKPNPPSPNLANSDLATVIQTAKDERERSIKSVLGLIAVRYDDLLKKAKFDFEREHLERQRDRDTESRIAEVKERYMARLSRTGALARELGDVESLKVLDIEVREGMRKRFDEIFTDITERKAERTRRYEPLSTLLKGSVCEFMMDGKVRKRGKLEADGRFAGYGSWTILSADHIKIYPSGNQREWWCFKVDVARKTGSLVREASEGTFRGEVSFRVSSPGS